MWKMRFEHFFESFERLSHECPRLNSDTLIPKERRVFPINNAKIQPYT
jgi:hypothetical protein